VEKDRGVIARPEKAPTHGDESAVKIEMKEKLLMSFRGTFIMAGLKTIARNELVCMWACRSVVMLR